MKKWNQMALASALVAACGWASAQAMDPLQVRSWAAACANCGEESPARLAGLIVGFDRNLGAHGAAQRHHTVIDDPVVNLHAIAALAQHARLVQRVQMLRHIGLRGVDFSQQFAHILLAIAQAADDLEPHRRGHDAKHLGRQLEDLV